MRVLVVDDSVVFRSQIRSALEGVDLIEVVGAANNGKIALQKLAQSSVDLVTLDMEMPEMSGIETIREIRKAKFPVRIIVFSSHTTRGSEAALEALSAGADDFLAKPSGPDVNISNASEKIRAELLPKILQFVARDIRREARAPTTADVRPSSPKAYLRKEISTFKPSVIVVGSSTGGPPALEKVLSGIKNPFRIPVLIAQHMPPVFTASLAKRIHTLTGVEAAEGKNGEEVLANRIYIAPGDYHMTLIKNGVKICLKLDQSPQRNSVRPAVDPLFESAAEIYGDKTLGLILTGMGEDGLVGSRRIKELGGGVMIQDKSSCVVFGMPGAIHQAGFYDDMGNLEQINQNINQMLG